MSNLVKSVMVLALLLIVASSTLYVVSETERGVKLRFGRLIEADIQPGLHVKLPFADDVRLFDARVLTVDAQPASFFTVEKKRLIVDSYAKWRISNVETYYKATGGVETVARNRLANRVNNGLRNQFGTRTLHEVVSGERDALMEDITSDLNESVLGSLGIEVVDVRVKRIDLPQEVSSQVFRRMTAEREKEATELRSTGKEKAERIRASADRERTIELANAYRDAEQLRGTGDAEAAGIYADAYQQDPEFYSFVRSLNAYKNSFSNKGDVMLVAPDSDFFKYLQSQEGK
ncbi:HflC protein [gamma proteobacterium HTCC2207]|jgi:membrane protease subunit HflC|uniref:Protein HflC n=1 Tax=gamma proteobacterium HTCC2207 TaxID=314287 RepID=Q1YRY4_9GAMM|nr:HflC protein [gamma proteobacterium HTCC2207]MBT5105810.1 protease modulator HflC [Porticoccaceae bacterium]MBT6114195.1 protease modulator HflC [Porticoccaceae bacterium]MDB4427421.1 protease modulator HflC [Porticoccaceae bacterium]MDC0517080.1 protease modulator HflC [Porticoccaceae bacterium]